MTTMKVKWVKRWRYEISARPVLPGVWRRREGGFLVRGKVTDPRTKVQRQLFKVLDVETALEARAWLEAEQQRVKAGTEAKKTVLFADYAASLAERKAADGRIKSAHSRAVIASIYALHLLPAFGRLPIDQVRRVDVMRWRDAAVRGAPCLSTRGSPRARSPSRRAGCRRAPRTRGSPRRASR